MNPKLCKDCGHFDPKERECRHPLNVGFDIVMGGTKTLRNPHILRGETGQCGPDADWFEPKEAKEAA